MAKITKFTKPNANALHAAGIEAFKALALQHGLTVRQAGGSIEDTRLVLKFEFRVTDEAATDAAAREEWATYCYRYDLASDDFGLEITYGGERYRLCGFAPRKQRCPIKAVRLRDGTTRLLMREGVLFAVQKEKAAAAGRAGAQPSLV